MNRNKALIFYLAGTMGQIVIACVVVYIFRNAGMKVDFSTPLGLVAVAIGGTSSALWGILISRKYGHKTMKKILCDFFNVKQPLMGYAIAAGCILLDFGHVFFGGQLVIGSWYQPFVLFFMALLFGGIEEFGWRYTFQPILQEKMSYTVATLITFVSWGIWHMMYFYIDGSLSNIVLIDFLIGLLVLCFILSLLYSKTKSLWLCVMTHALFNMFSQITNGGNAYISYVFRGIIIIVAILWCQSKKKQAQ